MIQRPQTQIIGTGGIEKILVRFEFKALGYYKSHQISGTSQIYNNDTRSHVLLLHGLHPQVCLSS